MTTNAKSRAKREKTQVSSERSADSKESSGSGSQNNRNRRGRGRRSRSSGGGHRGGRGGEPKRDYLPSDAELAEEEASLDSQPDDGSESVVVAEPKKKSVAELTELAESMERPRSARCRSSPRPGCASRT